MKFDKSIHRAALIRHTTHGPTIDCGRLSRTYSGGEITFNSFPPPPIQPKLRMGRVPHGEHQCTPSSSGSSHRWTSHTIDEEIAHEFTGYAPGILLSRQDFSYEKWGDKESWLNLVENRTLVAETNLFVQVNMENKAWSECYGVNLYFVTQPYVQDTTRWEPMYTDDQSGFSLLVPAQDQRNLKAVKPFHLYVPAPGKYVLIAHYTTASGDPLPKIIDPDEYNQKDDWSFLPMEC